MCIQNGNPAIYDEFKCIFTIKVRPLVEMGNMYVVRLCKGEQAIKFMSTDFIKILIFGLLPCNTFIQIEINK